MRQRDGAARLDAIKEFEFAQCLPLAKRSTVAVSADRRCRVAGADASIAREALAHIF